MLRLIRHLIGGALFWSSLAGTALAVPTATFVEPTPELRCFSKAMKPAVYKTVSERVMVRPGYEKTRHVPAVYEQGRLQVMVKEPDFSYRTIAPSYVMKYEEILVQPEHKIEVNIPAKYESWTESIEIEPAKTVWKRGKGFYGHETVHPVAITTDAGRATNGDVLCKVTIPAKKRIVHHTRMVSPPRTETRTVPARYERVARQVVKRPAFAQKIMVSGDYASIPYEKTLIAERHEVEFVPPTYQDVEKQVVHEASQLLPVEVLCDQHASRETVRELQTALVNRGYTIRVDGIYGPETQAAMERFQQAEGLLHGYMTLQSISALGIQPKTCEPATCGDQRAQTTVIAAQAALSSAGYYTAPDGIHGPRTQAALERYQTENGLDVGYLSAETMRALNVIARI